MTRPGDSWPFDSNPDRPNKHDTFSHLYRRHGHEVWALVYARWRDADAADDIKQETFLRLWKQWAAGEAILSPRAWLLRVARNLAEDHGKSAFRRNGTHGPEMMRYLSSSAATPPDEAEWRELLQKLQEALSQLSELYRGVFVLHHMEDLDLVEIAREVGRTVAAVRSLLWRTRQQLRRAILDTDTDDDDQAAVI